jgi:hypothetical protein
MTEETKKQNGDKEVVVEKQDILDQIKRVELMVKQATLIKMMSEIKRMSHEVLELKEKCTAVLVEVGVNTDDVKRVIDFANNLPSVQLNDNDKEAIRKWAKDEVQGKRKDIEKKVEDKIKPYDFFAASAGNSIPLVAHGNWGDSADNIMLGSRTISSNMVFCSTDGKEMKVTL